MREEGEMYGFAFNVRRPVRDIVRVGELIIVVEREFWS
jgi:hypothetical protein